MKTKIVYGGLDHYGDDITHYVIAEGNFNPFLLGTLYTEDQTGLPSLGEDISIVPAKEGKRSFYFVQGSVEVLL
jgi:hypothetical protein